MMDLSMTQPSKMKTATLLWIFVGLYYFICMTERKSITKFGKEGRKVQTEGEEKGEEFSHDFMLRPGDEFTPRIAWLMSFPNSGTSYTMSLVARASNRSFATNYGDEVTPKDASGSLSIYPQRPEGPFWPGMSGKMLSPRPLPDHFVLTKTHCGSRCMSCGPREYIETAEEFLQDCATGHSRPALKRASIGVHYPPERVAKAIHLIRNPFNNIISRYHQEIKNQRDKNETGWLTAHPNNATGFQLWCRELDDISYRQDVRFFGEEKIPKAPCHGEFYKYAQWHNLVHESIELVDHKVPILPLYYEDYADRLIQTTTTLLRFLQLDLLGDLREYAAKTDFSNYFIETQEKDIKSLVQSVASNTTWGEIKHYFEDL
jgi:hypothetical protein